MENVVKIKQGPFTKAFPNNEEDTSNVLTRKIITQRIVDGWLTEETIERTYSKVDPNDYGDTTTIKRIVKVNDGS
jgi:hypothetical protein